MRSLGLPSALAILLTLPAAAQIEYDAGVAGNPPVAPSPTTQGWSETITGSATVADVSPDNDFPLNAWQINDSGAGLVRYGDQFEPGSGKDYEVEMVMRPLAGTIALEYGSGWGVLDNYFDIRLELVGNDIHIPRGNDPPIVCPDAVDGYHSYRFYSGYGWCVAFVFYDGVYMGNFDISGWGVGFGPYTTWGTYDAEAGRARFHYVRMGLPESRPLGESYCGPANDHSGGLPARMLAAGIPNSWKNDVTLQAVDLPTNTFGYFLVSQTQGFVANPGGSQGNLCLGGSIGRYAKDVANSGPSGTISLSIDLQNLPTSPPSSVLQGETWNFQMWFRDVNPTQTSNFTDGLAIHFPLARGGC